MGNLGNLRIVEADLGLGTVHIESEVNFICEPAPYLHLRVRSYSSQLIVQ